MHWALNVNNYIASRLYSVEISLVIVKNGVQNFHGLKRNISIKENNERNRSDPNNQRPQPPTPWCRAGAQTGPTWCTRAQACSSVMGAEKTLRIWPRLRQWSVSREQEYHTITTNYTGLSSLANYLTHCAQQGINLQKYNFFWRSEQNSTLQVLVEIVQYWII